MNSYQIHHLMTLVKKGAHTFQSCSAQTQWRVAQACQMCVFFRQGGENLCGSEFPLGSSITGTDSYSPFFREG